MKSAIKLLLTGIAAILVSSASLMLLNSCKKPQDPPPPSSEQLFLVKNNLAVYRVVRPETATKQLSLAAARLCKELREETGVDVDILTDWEDKDDNADIPEILIGKTNRQESIEAAAELESKQFLIRQIGNKIVILGSSDSALDYAVTQFISLCTFSKEDGTASVSVPENLHILEHFEESISVAMLVAHDGITYADDLATALKAQYPRFTVYQSTDSLSDIFNKQNHDLVILCGIEKVPSPIVEKVGNFMNQGGRLLTLGGPAFEEISYSVNGKWMTKDEYIQSVLDLLLDDEQQLIFDTSNPKLPSQLGRSTDTDSHKVTKTVDDYDGPDSDAQLRVEVDNLGSWELIKYNWKVDLEKPTAIGFYAKGDDDTSGLYIEIGEKDGSRWYATILMDTEWDYHMITADDFTFWDGPASRKQGKPNFSDITSISFGFAQSGQPTPTGHHTYYLSQPKLLQIADLKLLGKSTSSVLQEIDGLSPDYEQYPITNASQIVTASNQIFMKERTYTVPQELISCHPGRQGTGYGNGRTSRFIPLLEVTDSKGLHSGYAAWINLFSSTTKNNGSMEGSMLGCVSAVSMDFYDKNGIAAVCDMVRAMAYPAYLVEGGADEYIYVASDTDQITLGGSWVTFNEEVSGLDVSVSLYRDDQLLHEFRASGEKISELSNRIRTITQSYSLTETTPNHVVTTLYQDGTAIDSIQQNISFWSPAPLSERHYVKAENNGFTVDGKPLTLFGVNYMPSSGVAEPNGALFEYYVSAAAYDPDVIRMDLLHIKDIGMNAVSVFVYYHTIQESNNILDLIEQCRELGIYVDLSIRPSAYPVSGYNAKEVQVLIEKLHFAENDNLVAYDIAWEMRFGQDRERYNSAWKQWIIDQYGSLANAESLWKVKIPKDASGNPCVTAEMLDSTSDRYLAITTAYRRFVDDLVSRIFNEAIQQMHEYDPNHLISFRMSNAGCPDVAASEYWYDYQSLASTLDFMSPEGYSITGEPKLRALQVLFANTYARYTNPGRPVVWKEYGKHVWSGSNFNDTSFLLDMQEEFYSYMLDLCYRSYTSGMYCWYYAGGYRIGENSDYGILNPDGSDRPCTALLRKYAPMFIQQGAMPEPNLIITLERDDYANGITGMYATVKSQLEKALEQGKTVAFIDRQQDAPGSNSYADTLPLAPIGNTAAEGTFPLRYINGQIKGYETFVKDGQTYARITVCNTLPATWRAGTVSVVSVEGSDVVLNAVIDQDVAYLEDVVLEVPITKQGDVALRFSISDTLFGWTYRTKD